MPETPDARNAIGSVLGRTPSGLFILTARSSDGRETGMLASWVQQASFEPPMVTVAVNKKRFLHEWLTAAPQFALSLVGDGQKQFLKQFGAGFGPDEAAFNGVSIDRSPAGLPVLTDALGYLECRVAGQLDAGDHVVYVAEIQAAAAGPELNTIAPWVHIRKNGFGY